MERRCHLVACTRMLMLRAYVFFFFNDTATTEIYTLSLHDALPLSAPAWELTLRLSRHCWATAARDRKSTRLNSSHMSISYAVFCLKKKTDNSNRASTTSNLYALRTLTATVIESPVTPNARRNRSRTEAMRDSGFEKFSNTATMANIGIVYIIARTAPPRARPMMNSRLGIGSVNK